MARLIMDILRKHFTDSFFMRIFASNKRINTHFAVNGK